MQARPFELGNAGERRSRARVIRDETEKQTMPKWKTNSGAAKRFRKTASGYKHRCSNRNHILTKKTPKRKRRLRTMSTLAAGDQRLVVRMMRH